jgi:hypothetical protein
MTKADTDNPDTILLQQLLSEVDQLQNPWVIVERRVFYFLSTTVFRGKLPTTYLSRRLELRLCHPNSDTLAYQQRQTRSIRGLSLEISPILRQLFRAAC